MVAHPRVEPIDMTSKPTDNKKDSHKDPKVSHPGMMGDGTEEQNLGQKGNPDARIKKDEVVDAFGEDKPKR